MPNEITVYAAGAYFLAGLFVGLGWHLAGAIVGAFARRFVK